MSEREHDVIVVGAGPAGEVACGAAAREGLDVALVERELVGGECAYWACMPSKALLRPGELLAEDARVPGVPIGELTVQAVLDRRDEVIHDLSDEPQMEWLDSRGVILYRGQARLDGERRVTVDSDTVLIARRAIVLAPGSGALIPPIDGLAEIRPWTNREATTAKVVPGRLIVLGGGAVGCEMAQAWSSLGAQVTLVEGAPGLLPSSEPFAGELVAQSLADRGVELHLGSRAVEAGRGNEGEIRLELDSGAELVADELLVCVGRVPHTDDLGLETVDLNPGETIPVDDHMRVPGHGDWLYAVGDANGRALLTQAGKYQAAIAIANIMNRDVAAEWDGPMTPQVVFSEPQVAAVGHTLESALKAGIRAKAVDGDPGSTPGASFIGKGGLSKSRIVVDEDREVMVGATFVAPRDQRVPARGPRSRSSARYRCAGWSTRCPAFPTRNEMWLRLLADWRP